MTDPQPHPHARSGDLPGITARSRWYWVVLMGAIMIAGGLLSLLNPFLGSLTVQAFAAAAFGIVGAMKLVDAVRDDAESTGGRVLTGLLGAVFVLFALSLLLNPLAGLLSLTFLAALLFLAIGVLQIGFGWRLRPARPWGWMVASGAVSVLLGLFILLTLPESGLVALGLLLAVDLLSSGAAYLVLGLTLRRPD